MLYIREIREKPNPPVSTGGTFKTKKTKYMPLGPKQQPPYYIPEPMPTPPSGTGTRTRLNTQYADTQTTGTTETDIYTYSMPANTLTQNNDTIEITYAAIQGVGANDHIHRFYINAVNQFTHDDLGTDPPIIKIQIIRTSTTTARMSMTFTAGTSVYTYEQTANTLNFTTPIIIKFTGQCTTTAYIQGYTLTIDKQST